MDFELRRNLETIIEFTNFLQNFKRTELTRAEFRTFLMNLNILGRKPDSVFRLKTVRGLLIALVCVFHVLLAESQCSFSVFASSSKVVQSFFE